MAVHFLDNLRWNSPGINLIDKMPDLEIGQKQKQNDTLEEIPHMKWKIGRTCNTYERQ